MSSLTQGKFLVEMSGADSRKMQKRRWTSFERRGEGLWTREKERPADDSDDSDDSENSDR